MRRLTLAGIVTAAALAATGCAGRATYASGGVYATASTPDLVAVGDGVYVIRDYDEPIFYADNYYWRYYGNTWYRSPYYNRGWVYARPPSVIARIDSPYRYRNYRGGQISRRDRGYYREQPRTYRGRPVVRRPYRY